MAIPMLKIRRPLTWKSPYVDKTVFILRRGPVLLVSRQPVYLPTFLLPGYSEYATVAANTARRFAIDSRNQYTYNSYR